MDYSKGRNGHRMEITIELFQNDPNVSRENIIEEITKRSKNIINEDTAGCIKTMLDLLKQGTIKIKNSKVVVPVVNSTLLKNLKTEPERGWFLTAEALRIEKASDTDILELAKKYQVDYIGSRGCIRAGVRNLYQKGLIEYATVTK
ncbi:hypothetical protein [Pelosinus sp. sgz500959]|uniref:hypothetical protein n=1 Tax=Pelosinus sp. sgz500959 TaxID=3242472 RepID=UPI00366B7D90